MQETNLPDPIPHVPRGPLRSFGDSFESLGDMVLNSGPTLWRSLPTALGIFAGTLAYHWSSAIWTLSLQNWDQPRLTRWLYYLPVLALYAGSIPLVRCRAGAFVLPMALMALDPTFSDYTRHLGWFDWTSAIVIAVLCSFALDHKPEPSVDPRGWFWPIVAVLMMANFLYPEIGEFPPGLEAMHRSELGSTWEMERRMAPPLPPPNWNPWPNF